MSNAERTRVDTVKRSLDELHEMIEGSGSSMLRSDRVSISKSTATKLIDKAIDSLPAAIKEAAGVLAEKERILLNAKNEAEQEKRKATDEAKKIVEDARREAEKLRQEAEKENAAAKAANDETQRNVDGIIAQAKQQGEALVQDSINRANGIFNQARQDEQTIKFNAEQEAQRIVARAHQEKAFLVSKENVLQEASVKAREMLEDADIRARNLRDDYMQFIDRQLYDADVYFAEVLDSIRGARINLKNGQ